MTDQVWLLSIWKVCCALVTDEYDEMGNFFGVLNPAIFEHHHSSSRPPVLLGSQDDRFPHVQEG